MFSGVSVFFVFVFVLFCSFFLCLTVLMLYLLFLNYTLILVTLTNHPKTLCHCRRASWVITVPTLDKWLPDKMHVLFRRSCVNYNAKRHESRQQKTIKICFKFWLLKLCTFKLTKCFREQYSLIFTSHQIGQSNQKNVVFLYIKYSVGAYSD